jgi:hypothetical protein
MGMRQWNGNNLPPAPGAGAGHGFGYRGGPAFGAQEWRATRGADFAHHAKFFNEMPQEIRDKEVEAEKLRIDLGNILSQKPLNKDKAVELNGQIGKLKQEIKAWRFEQKLNRIEEFNKKAAEQSEAKQDK